jgi:hypothetical protein
VNLVFAANEADQSTTWFFSNQKSKPIELDDEENCRCISRLKEGSGLLKRKKERKTET